VVYRDGKQVMVATAAGKGFDNFIRFNSNMKEIRAIRDMLSEVLETN
jgi:hypothetical protein